MICTFNLRFIISETRKISRAACLLILIGGITGCEELTPDETDSPTVARTIDDHQMKADDEPLEFDLTHFFEAPGEGRLEYQAGSSDTDVLEATVSEETLIVEPTGGGKAMVTVEAGFEEATTDMSFEVTVTLPDPPNRPD